MDSNDVLNTFTKGIVADLDPIMVSQQQWVFPTLNIRVMNKEGQGVIATVINGNALEFTLTPGFLAIGSCEYNGIAYIVSFNKTSQETEIGCYPSPNTLDYSTPSTVTFIPQIQRQYRPLRNYTGSINPSLQPVTPQNAIRIPLRTDKFEGDIQHQISVFAKESYDNSVDLYLADYKNPNRIVNTGFDQSGMYNDRLYWDNDFYSSINQVQVSGTVLTEKLNTIDNNNSASLLCGVYFAHFRYADANMNTTAFISESNACQVFQGDLSTVEGVEGGSATTNSNKEIVFDLINVDTTYSYIQVVLTRFYSNVQGIQLNETFLVDIDYIINGPTMSITITGNETWEPFDDALLLQQKSTEVCCKDHIQINNRYYGGNWLGTLRFHKALVDFAQQIIVGYDDSLTKDAGQMSQGTSGQVLGQYTDYQFTYSDVGYFRGEAYAYGLIYELLDGTLSDTFPCQGSDDYNGVGTGATNNEGIYRFPKQLISNSFTNNKINILGVKFDNTNAISWLTGNTSEQQWFKSNVRAIYYVRAERMTSLIGQGLMMNCCLPSTNDTQSTDLTIHSGYSGYYCYPGQTNNANNNGKLLGQFNGKFAGEFFTALGISDGQCWVNDFWNAHEVWDNLNFSTNAESNVSWNETSNLFPVYRGYMPMMFFRDEQHILGIKVADKIYRYYQSRWPLQPNKYAFYSPDILFNPAPDVTNFNYVKRVGSTLRYGTYDYWDNIQSLPDERPRVGIAEMITKLETGDNRNVSKIANKHVVGFPSFSGPNKPINNVGGYCNEFMDYETDNSNYGIYMTKNNSDREYWSNRNVLSAPYIAIEVSDDNTVNTDGSYNLDIVNIYSADVDNLAYDILTPYGITPTTTNTNLYYSKISDAITLDFVNNLVDFGLADSITGSFFRTYYKGDCFLQKFYFKQLSWDHSDFQGDTGNALGEGVTDTSTGTGDFVSHGPVWDEPGGNSSNSDKARYAHGLIIGIVVECATNPAMRHEGNYQGNTTSEFYPHTSYGNAWSYLPKYHAGDESFLYNYGYHRQLSLQQFIHYNPYLTYQVLKHKTRIRYTPLNIPYDFTDAYRILLANDFKDYDLQYGQINALLNINNKLVSVQESQISEHLIEQIQVKTNSTAGALIIGDGDTLSQLVRSLAPFGSQHQWSVNKRGFGVDWKRRVIWGIGVSQTDSGEIYTNVNNLSRTQKIEKWVYDLFDYYDTHSDIINNLPDTPVYGVGIVTGFDLMYRDIIFTFLLKKLTTWIYRKPYPRCLDNLILLYGQTWFDALVPVIYVPGTLYHAGQLVYDESTGTMYYLYSDTNKPLNSEGCKFKAEPVYEQKNISLVYNIDMAAFIGEVSFTPNIYMNINNEMFTNDGSDIYLHNYNAIPALFYGVQYKGILSFIVNGGERHRHTTKMFTNETLESNDNPFSRILYETQYQQSIHNGDTVDDFRTVDFWRNPEYNEHKWELPIFVQTSQTDDDFNTDSEMRGQWLKVTVEYFKNIPQYIKKTITKFIISKTS